MALETVEYQEYRPILLSRRGEVIAWLLALATGVTTSVVWFLTGKAPWFSVVLAVFFLLAGLSISLGNWMDRQTSLRIDSEGIAFQNGLRNVRLPWEQLEQIRVLPGRWGGRRIQVIGDSAYFAFQTMGEVRVGGQMKGRLGFEQGEEILRLMLALARLQRIADPGVAYEYYAR